MNRVIHTSKTDPIRVDWIPFEFTAPGRIGLTFAPGKQGDALASRVTWRRDLRADMRQLRDVERADVLVTLLEGHELLALRITGLFAEAKRQKMQVRHMPIKDVDVPREPRRLRWLLDKLHEHVEQGHNVVVHCAGGLGRSGVVVGCFLVSGGMTADRALRTLLDTRGPRCPETLMQVAFIRGFERSQQERERRRARPRA